EATIPRTAAPLAHQSRRAAALPSSLPRRCLPSLALLLSTPSVLPTRRRLRASDKNPSPRADSLFKQVFEAYDVLLSDPQKRAIYDQYGEDGLKARTQVPLQHEERRGDLLRDIRRRVPRP
ncbi:unnamed protein product, partial [Urochloa humidicola]